MAEAQGRSSLPLAQLGAGKILGTSFADPFVNEIKLAAPEPKGRRSSRLSAFFTQLLKPSPTLDELVIHNVTPKTNGFFDTVLSTYNQHHALILRPDYVWIAILIITQFTFHINANAEILRANFVTHEEKKKFELAADAGQDFKMLAPLMVDFIQQNIVDPSLRAWALPDFTTTTLNDTIVSSIVLVASLKSYFEYSYNPCPCGIPRVTLEGERRDWEKILEWLEKLKEYGIKTMAWYHLLVPVISRFVKAYDDPSGLSNIKFWENVVRIDGGSGSDTYNNWITAFCVFDYRGRRLGTPLKLDVESSVPIETLKAKKFWATYQSYYNPRGVFLDQTHFHSIDSDQVPPSHGGRCYGRYGFCTTSLQDGRGAHWHPGDWKYHGSEGHRSPGYWMVDVR